MREFQTFRHTVMTEDTIDTDMETEAVSREQNFLSLSYRVDMN